MKTNHKWPDSYIINNRLSYLITLRGNWESHDRCSFYIFYLKICLSYKVYISQKNLMSRHGNNVTFLPYLLSYFAVSWLASLIINKRWN